MLKEINRDYEALVGKAVIQDMAVIGYISSEYKMDEALARDGAALKDEKMKELPEDVLKAASDLYAQMTIMDRMQQHSNSMLQYFTEHQTADQELTSRLINFHEKIQEEIKEVTPLYENSKNILSIDPAVKQELAAFVVMAKNPNMRYQDLMDPSKEKAAKATADQMISDAIIAYLGDPEGARGKITEVMETAMQGLSGMDPRKEMLYALGSDPSLSDSKEIKAIFEKPENLTKLNASMAQLSKSAETLSAFFSHSWVKDMVPSVDSLQYQSFQNALDAAAIMAAGSEFERKAEEAEEGYHRDVFPPYFVNRAAISALAEAPGMQSLNGSSLRQSWENRNIVSSLLEGKNLQLIYTKDDLKNHKIEEKDISFYVNNISYGTVVSADSFYRNHDNEKMMKLGATTLIHGLPREASHRNAAVLYGLSEGHTISELLDPANAELRYSMGDKMIAMVENYPTSSADGKPLPTEVREQSMRVYAEMFHKALVQLSKEEIPVFDPANMEEAEKAYSRLNIIGLAALDSTQLMQDLNKEPAFIQAFGGQDEFKHYDALMYTVGTLTKRTENCCAPFNSQIDRITGALITEGITKDLMGKQFKDYNMSLDELNGILNKEINLITDIGLLTPDQQNQMEKYVFHHGPLPKIDRIERFLPVIESYDKAATKLKENAKLQGFYANPYPEHFTKATFDSIVKDCHVDTFDRKGTRTSLAYAYIMSEHHMTLKEVLDLDQQSLARYSEEFVNKLQQYPIGAKNLTPEQSVEMARFYGKLYKNMSDAIMKETLPVTDIRDVRQMAEHAKIISAVGRLCKDVYQSELTLKSAPGFADAFGGPEGVAKNDEKLEHFGELITFAFNMHDPDKTMAERVGYRAGFDYSGAVITGKPLGEIEYDPQQKLMVNAGFISYVSFESKLNKLETLPGKDNARVVAEMKRDAELYSKGLCSLKELKEYSAFLGDYVKRDMMMDRPQDYQLNKVQKNATHEYKIGLDRQPGSLEKMMNAAASSGNFINEKHIMAFNDMNGIFQSLTKDIKEKIPHEGYQKAGFRNQYDAVYINGQKLEDYVDGLYPNIAAIKGNYPEPSGRRRSPYEELMIREAVSCILTGSHSVDVMRVGTNEKGGYEIGATSVTMDKQELFTLAAMQGVQLPKSCFKPAESRESVLERQNTLIARRSEALYKAAMKEMAENEVKKNPFVEAKERFDTNGPKINDQYFNASIQSDFHILSERAKNTEVTFSSDYTLLRNCAQLVALADNPQMRFADLTDPSKFPDEKMKAGQMVSEAFKTYFKGSENGGPDFMKPALDLISKSMKAVSNMNVRKELLYALGEDMELKDPAKIREIMDRKENAAMVNGFLTGMNAFAETAEDALSNQKRIPKLIVQSIIVTEPDVYSNFLNASTNLKAMDGDQDFNNKIEAYMKGQAIEVPDLKEALIAQSMMDYTRDVIAQSEEAYKIPKEVMKAMKEQEAEMKASLTFGETEKLPSIDQMMRNELSPEIREKLKIISPEKTPEVKKAEPKLQREAAKEVQNEAKKEAPEEGRKRSFKELVAEENSKTNPEKKALSGIAKWKAARDRQNQKAGLSDKKDFNGFNLG